MSGLRTLLIAVLILVPSERGVAQATRIREVLQRRGEEAPHSVPWICLSFELIEAELNTDVRKAKSTAMGLYESEEAMATRGAREAVAAYVALASCLGEGPLKSQDWISRSEIGPATEAHKLLRVYYYLARARVLRAQGNHASELSVAVIGEKLAQETGVAALKLRGGLMTYDATPGRNPSALRELFDAELPRARDGDLRSLELRLHYEEHLRHKNAGRDAEANAILDQMEGMAKDSGDRRMLGLVHLRRGRFAYKENRNADAVDLYRKARAEFEVLDDISKVAYTVEIEADAEIRLRHLDRAQELVTQNLTLIRDRGLSSNERGILETRFALAVKQRNAELAAQLDEELEHSEKASDASDRDYDDVRNRLRSAEREREMLTANLRSEKERFQERTRWTWTLAGIGIALAASTVAILACRSRSRLLVGNRLLADQIERVRESEEERAKLEHRMRQLERSECLGLMAAGIAHDFNNILTGIMGGAERLEQQVSSSEQSEAVRMIQSASQQAARLCRQLQSYVGGESTQYAPLNLQELALEVLPLLHYSVQGQLEVSVESVPADVWATVDRAEMEQVFLNLVLNARDANAIRVCLRVEKVLDVSGQHAALISVVDDGDGMTPEVAQRIFDPFFTTRFPGRGLGLSVVHGVVMRHAGRISVESAARQGAKFSILLPLTEVAVTPPSLKPSMAVSGDTPAASLATVLVVDDEPVIRRLIGSVASERGHLVIDADGGDAALSALEKIEAGTPLIVFVDLTMPDPDGREVVRCVRAKRPDARIVIMSGHTGPWLDQAVTDLSPDRVLEKPFNLGSVRALLGDLQPCWIRETELQVDSARSSKPHRIE